ncbi:MAG: hypothetical protein N4A49_03990 [Marinifilaceae bacterium]|jgi:hypothetical protein|nr:hypothetical protein [Marinifilaceae bacterium]
MVNINYYQQILEELLQIPDEEVTLPDTPLDLIIQEAEDLHFDAKKDIIELQKAGLNINIVNELPNRINALEIASSKCEYKFRNIDELTEKWQSLAETTYIYRAQLIEYYQDLFLGNTDYINKLEKFRFKENIGNLANDILSLYQLGIEFSEDNKNIDIDSSLISKSKDYSNSLNVLSRKCTETKFVNSESDIRDRAFWYLKDAVNNIREAGNIAFKNSEDKVLNYKSEYFLNICEPKETSI